MVWWEELQCPGHSNWTICRLLSLIWSIVVPKFVPLYWGTNSYHPAVEPTLRIGNSLHSEQIVTCKIISTGIKIDKTEVLQCLRQQNMTVHSPISQVDLNKNFSFESDLNSFLLLYWGTNSSHPAIKPMLRIRNFLRTEKIVSEETISIGFKID